MSLSVQFTDPRLVAIYDAVNAYGPGSQPDFYLARAKAAGARDVLELGCGTGIVSLHFAAQSFRVTGAEPAPAMLARAREKPGAQNVTWLEGGAERFSASSGDFAFMAGHVAQFFLNDGEWAAALSALHAALRPGGLIAFESRNPERRDWERWTPERRRRALDTAAGPIEVWASAEGMAGGVLSYTNHYHFERSGETLAARSALRFRSQGEIEASLTVAGFIIEDVYGDWDASAVTRASPEFIFVARR